MVDPDERSATCTSATASGALPKTLDTCTCAEVPPMLVCTIWRNVCWPNDWPPLSGDTDQVPVQGVLAATLFTAKAPPAAGRRDQGSTHDGNAQDGKQSLLSHHYSN